MRSNLGFVNAEYLLKNHVVNTKQPSIIICLDKELWHEKKATADTVKTEMVSKLLSILPDLSLEKISSCVSVREIQTQKVGNFNSFWSTYTNNDLYGFREGYITNQTFKIEIGKNLFLQAQEALLSESLNNPVSCSR